MFPNIPEDRLDAMRQEAIFKTHQIEAPPLSRGLVSCTGSQFCGIALIETKNRCLSVPARMCRACQTSREGHCSSPHLWDSR